MRRLSPMVCAHRGRSGVAPENTLVAFEQAIELGVDFIECDVHRTNDGAIVVMHDAAVNRTTDGDGQISQMTLEEIRALDAGSWKDESYAGERVPTLAEALEAVVPHCVLDIEIKQRGIAEQVVEEVRAAGAVRGVSIVSFDLEDLRQAKAGEPRLACGRITGGPESEGREGVLQLIEGALEVGANFLTCSHRAITEEMVYECHVRGLALMAWTMDTEEDVRAMRQLEVDALVSNYPELVLELL